MHNVALSELERKLQSMAGIASSSGPPSTGHILFLPFIVAHITGAEKSAASAISLLTLVY